MIQGSASQYAGQGRQAQAAWQYLNPAIASSSMLFREINRDTSKFTNFIVKSSNLVSDIAQRQLRPERPRPEPVDDDRGARQRSAPRSGSRSSELPPFMRLANTTFVNLRSALDDLTPLVNASKPVAPKLQKLLVQLRPLADDVRPDRPRPGEHRQPARSQQRPDRADRASACRWRTSTVHNVNANGKLRPGAFPQSTIALNELDARARVRAPVRGRSDRLVRGLLASRRATTPTAARAGSRRSSASPRSRTARSTSCPTLAQRRAAHVTGVRRHRRAEAHVRRRC